MITYLAQFPVSESLDKRTFVNLVIDWNQGSKYDKFEQLEWDGENFSVCFLQVLFGKSCKIFLENVASPNWRKLQSLDWQLSCQPYSHCRPNLVVTA